MVFSNNEKEDPPLKHDYISGVNKFKDSGVLFTK
jgi:hypothetical protein